MSPERKRLYAVIIITVFSFIIVTGIGNFRAEQLAANLTGSVVTNAVSRAADGLEVGKMQAIIDTLDKNHPYYSELRAHLININKEHNLKNLYIYYKNEKEMKWIVVADAREESDPLHKNLGESEKRVSAAVEKTIRGKTVQAEYLGTTVSSFQEIKDAKGKTFAVLGGDYDAGQMTDFLFLTKYVQIGIITVALLLIGGAIRLTRRKGDA